MEEGKDDPLRSVYRKRYKLHGIWLVSFNGGIQRSNNFLFTALTLVKYALRETRHVLKEGMGINVTNKFIRK